MGSSFDYINDHENEIRDFRNLIGNEYIRVTWNNYSDLYSLHSKGFRDAKLVEEYNGVIKTRRLASIQREIDLKQAEVKSLLEEWHKIAN